ncbi:alpha-1,2-mannosyltransferase ktr1 [Mycoemilia scoparia]|uniref:Alpha-1,2-mannosyltransferase ktr1 n=1 Tax=Mycoemilia scoparia TaxID=417184 RepID=A0A9W8DV48_9FUNG|nr:alpha-1,2-mannosyltransferase ktr1 [Mycoemilia scoparia]
MKFQRPSILMWTRNWIKVAAGLVFLTITFISIHMFYPSLEFDTNQKQLVWPPKGFYLRQQELYGNKTGLVPTEKSAMVALVRNSDYHGIRKTIQQIEDRFNREYGYPYILLNDEPFTTSFMRGLQRITKSRVHFGLLDKKAWGYSPYVSESKVAKKLEENKNRYIYGGSLSYRFMCRFQSGFIHKHPLLKSLDFYWRIEPDVSYYCDMPYDPFKMMKENDYKYGFIISPPEKSETVETLWKTTKEWIKKNKNLLPEKSFASLILDDNNDYNMCHFWSNFEIVDLSLYRSKAYESYFQHLDRAGGFFYERWGDAPVHSIAAALFLTKSQIHWFEDVGYNHIGYSHCPHPDLMAQRCTCKAEDAYPYGAHCHNLFKERDDITKEELLRRLEIS